MIAIMRRAAFIIAFLSLLASCGGRKEVLVSKALDIAAEKLISSLMKAIDAGEVEPGRPTSVLFVEGADGRYGAEARDKLEKYLIKTGFNVVTPPSQRELEAILDMAKGSLSYEVFFDPALAVKLGKLIPPRQALVGRVKWVRRTRTGVMLALDGLLIDLERGNRLWRDDVEVRYRDSRPVLLRAACFLIISTFIFIGFRGLNDLTGARFPVVIYLLFLAALAVIFYFTLYDYLVDYLTGPGGG